MTEQRYRGTANFNRMQAGAWYVAVLLVVFCLLVQSVRVSNAQRQSGQLVPLTQAEQLGQARLLVGTYDPAHVNGLSMIAEQRAEGQPVSVQSFGVRVVIAQAQLPREQDATPGAAAPGVAVEEAPAPERITLFGPAAPDSSYARLHWQAPVDRKSLTLEWARLAPHVIIGRLVSRTALQVVLEAYRPFALNSGSVNFRAHDTQTLMGESVGQARTGSPLNRIVVRTERVATGANSYSNLPAFRQWLTQTVRAAQTSKQITAPAPAAQTSAPTVPAGPVLPTALAGPTGPVGPIAPTLPSGASAPANNSAANPAVPNLATNAPSASAATPTTDPAGTSTTAIAPVDGLAVPPVTAPATAPATAPVGLPATTKAEQDPLTADDLFAAQAYASLRFELKEKESIGFVIVLGDDFAALEKEAARVLAQPVAKQLAEAEARYEATRTRTDGWLGEAWESLQRAVQWNRVYSLKLQREIASSLRLPQQLPAASSAAQIAMQTVGWDGFLRALSGALIAPSHAQDALLALLAQPASDGRIAPLALLPVAETLAGNGNGATRALNGRSLPPVGALCVWKTYQATRDLQFLVTSYGRLKRWHEWWRTDRGDGQPWRDGNRDGLLEWGYDAELEVGELTAQRIPALLKAQAAASESGQPDSPQWGLQAEPLAATAASNNAAAASAEPVATATERVAFNERAHTLELTPVGLNALYALDAEMLSYIARELSLTEEAERWEREYLRLKALIDEKLWSEADKLYLNRRWDGKFIRRLTPDLFFVLAAGVPAPERAKLLLAALRDAQQFGGAAGLPTLARADKAFAPTERGRGDVSAALTYLVYLGLKHYSFYPEAAELARKGAALGQETWIKSGQVFDRFSSVDGSGLNTTTKRAEPAFGGLIWLTPLEELLTLDPWAGLTFGNEAVLGDASLQRVGSAGESFTIRYQAQQMLLLRNNEVELEFDQPVHLMSLRTNGRALTFYLETTRAVSLRVPPLPERPVSISVGNKLVVEAMENQPARLNLVPGIHRVVIVR